MLLSVKGFTLVESMVTIMVMSLFAFVATSLSTLLQNGKRVASLYQNRDQILALTRETASDLNAIRVSLVNSANSAFLNCVCGGTAGCLSGKIEPFTLFDSAGNAKSSKFYDSSGTPCVSTSAGCFIEVTTSFVAECMPLLPSLNPTPPPQCATPAEFVEIIYTIQQNPLTIGQGHYLKSFSGGVFMETSDINPLGSGACP